MASHALIYLFALALPGIVGFFSFGIYTRILSPEEYSVYSVGTSLSFLIGSVAYGWIRFAVSRYQSERPQTNFLPFVMNCFMSVTVLLLPLAFGALYLVKSLSSFAMISVGLLVISQALFEITQEIYRSRHLSTRFAWANISRSLLSFVCAIGGAFYFFSGAGLVLGISAGFLATALFFLFQNRASLGYQSSLFLESSRFLRYGAPLALSGLVFSGNTAIARMMVAGYLGAGDTGRFGAALDVTTQIALIVAASVSSILGPSAFKASLDGGTKAAYLHLSGGAELFLAALMPTTVGLVIMAHGFTDVIVGPRFEEAVQVMLPLLAVSRGLDAFSQFYLHLGFQLAERPLLQVVCGATTLAVNVAAAILLLPIYGVQGAVYALLIGDIVGVIVSFLLIQTIFPMPLPLRAFGRAGVCTLAMAAVCAPMASMLANHSIVSLVATPLVGAIVYGLSAYALDLAELRSRLFGAGVVEIRKWLK